MCIHCLPPSPPPLPLLLSRVFAFNHHKKENNQLYVYRQLPFPWLFLHSCNGLNACGSLKIYVLKPSFQCDDGAFDRR
jgi:hypothetical protein